MSQITTIFELIRVIIVLLLIFVYIPQLFLGIYWKMHIMDKTFMGITFTSFFMVLAAHILSFTKLMDIFALFFIFAFFISIFLRYDKEGNSYLGKKISNLIYLIDIFDMQKKDIFRMASSRNWFKGVLTQFKKIFEYPVLSLCTFFVFCAVLIVRMKYSVLHAAYPHIDMYLHLKWVKGIMMNDLFYNNEIYPKGMHAIYASVAKLTFIDPYMLVRFIGPIIGTMLVLAVYNLAFKVTNNRYAALLSMTIYGLTNFGLTNLGFFPSQMFRQSATMSQELGMLFVLFGLGFLIDYIQEKNKITILAFYSCIFLAFMVHSYAAMYLVIWSAVFMLIVLLYREITFKSLFSITTFSLLLIIFTFVPLLIGRLVGAEYHKSSIVMITDVSELKFSFFMVGNFFKEVFIPKDPYMYSVILGVLLIPLVRIISPNKYINFKKIFFIAVSLSTFVTYLLFNLPSMFSNTNIPLLFEKVRTGPFLCLLVPILIAQLFDLISDLISAIRNDYRELARQFINNILIMASVVYIVFMVLLNFFPWNVFYKNIEYDASAENYLRIKSDFFNDIRSTDWTIIGPDTQLAEVIGVGWHKDIYRFVREFSLEQLRSPNFIFPIPTHHIFVFIEKRPMFYGQSINLLDAEKDLDPEGEDIFMQYYMEGSQRAILEAKAWALVDAYKNSHEGVTVYYEDTEIIVYRIYQEKLLNSL